MPRKNTKRNDGNSGDDGFLGFPADGIIIMMSKKGEAETSTCERVEVSPPGKYNVIFHNDDVTPMVFVVVILKDVFGYDDDRATSLMWEIHEKGKGIAGTYIKSIADTKAKIVLDAAGAKQYPLKVTVEKAD